MTKMKNPILYFLLGALCAVLIWWFFQKPKTDQEYKEKVKELNVIISGKNAEIVRIKKQMKIDTFYYEKEIQNITKLRNRYANDAVLDSLFRAAYRLR